MYIKFAKVRDVITPYRANPGDALDFFIPGDFQETELFPHHNIKIPSGIKLEVPFGYAVLFVNKSGIAAKDNLIIGACLIDHGYSGEVHLDIHNIGKSLKIIKGNDKIAQAIIINIAIPQLIHVNENELYKDVLLVSQRGSGGFGSTSK